MTIEIPPLPPNTFPAARGAANKWRGECISLFAEAEQYLGALLIRAQNVPAYAALKPVFPHLVGQKFERLRKLVAANGPMRQRESSAITALDAFAVHNDLRVIICHGELDVAVTESSVRIFLFKIVAFRNNTASWTTTTFTQSEADIRRCQLAAAVKALTTEMALLKKTLPTNAQKI